MTARRPAYVIGSTEECDPADLARHVEQVRSTVERFGGRVCLAGPVTVLAGGGPGFATLVRFPDAVAAATWYDSADRTALCDLGRLGGQVCVWLVEEEP